MADLEYTAVRLNTKRLGQILLKEGIINDEDLTTALRIQTEKGGLLGEILIELGFITTRDIERVLFLQYGTGFPFVLLPEEKVVPLGVIALIPRDVSEKYCLIPFSRYQNILTVIISNPLDKEGLFRRLKQITGLEIQFFLGLSSQIERAIKFYYDLLEKKRGGIK
jgi:type IV pilus assembly protein PilB